MYDRNAPTGFVYVHRDGRALWQTKSRTAQQAAAKAMAMDVPPGGHVEELYDDDCALTPDKGAV